MLHDVLLQHPRVAAERENVETLESRIDLARSGFRPNAQLSYDRGRRQARTGHARDFYGNLDSRSLTVTQPLFNGFGTVAEMRAALARRDAGESRLSSVEQEVALAFINAWTDVSQSLTIMQLNEQNRNAMLGFRKATQERYDAQDATITDVAQAESRLALAEANYAAAQAAWDKAVDDYQRVTGNAPALSEMPPLPPALPASLSEVDANVKDAPEVIAAKQQEKAASYDVDVRKAALWPSVSLRGSLAQQEAIPQLAGYSHLEDNSVTLNFRMPLYQSGAEYARIREARTTYASAGFEAADTLREIGNRARRAWHDYQSSLEVAASSARAADAASHALEGVQSEYGEGTRTLLDVLDAQGELFSAKVRETQAQGDIRKHAYALLAASGRLTPQALGLEPAPRHEESRLFGLLER